jgi:hypothetical protein
MKRFITLGATVACLVGALVLAGSAVADRHGSRDLRFSGTVTAFDKGTGILSIQRTGGSTVTGTVTSRTEIECENEPANDNSGVSARKADHGGSSGRDGQGEDNHQAGDDNENENEDQNDNDDQNEHQPPAQPAAGQPPAPAPASGDDNGDNEQENEDAPGACDSSSLKVGTVVTRARVRRASSARSSSATLVFKQLKIAA